MEGPGPVTEDDPGQLRLRAEVLFLPWATAVGITEPGQITTRVLDRYTAHLLEHGGKRGPLSRYSVASFVESVNWWLRWLQAEGVFSA